MALTQDIATRLGLTVQGTTQADLYRAVDARLGLDSRVRLLFHQQRRTGNASIHVLTHGIGNGEGLESLKLAREAAVWFHHTFGQQPHFKSGPFQLPDDPRQKLAALQAQISSLRSKLEDAKGAQARQAEMARREAQRAAQEKAMARQAKEEAAVYETLADEAAQQYATLKAQSDAEHAQFKRTAVAP